MRISDWSSDVCSSDLNQTNTTTPRSKLRQQPPSIGKRASPSTWMRRNSPCDYFSFGKQRKQLPPKVQRNHQANAVLDAKAGKLKRRSEERREGRKDVRTGKSRGDPYNYKKKKE